jgi:hypothetical protein
MAKPHRKESSFEGQYGISIQLRNFLPVRFPRAGFPPFWAKINACMKIHAGVIIRFKQLFPLCAAAKDTFSTASSGTAV